MIRRTPLYAFFAYLALVPDDLVECLTSLDVSRQRDGGTNQGQGERRRGIHGNSRTAAGWGQYTPVFLGLDAGAKKGQSEHLNTPKEAQAADDGPCVGLRRKEAS